MAARTHKELQLRGDLRQAFENWMGDMVDGPWEDIIGVVATAVERGHLTMAAGARLDLALARTKHDIPDCEVCGCPCPGMAHG